VCALGLDAATLWAGLVGAQPAVKRVPWLPDVGVPIGSYVPDDAMGTAEGRERRLDRVTRLALMGARGALGSAGLLDEGGRIDVGLSSRAGAILGTSRGATGLLEQALRSFADRGARGVGPHVSPLSTTGGLSASVARHLGLRGPNLTVSAACSSGAQAIGMAFDQIRLGRADVMVAGGAEACLTPFCMAMFQAAGILSRRVGEPERACRPFDRERDGTVVGEGAGVVVLEAMQHARQRGARMRARLAGFGASCDALSLTGVPEDGEGLVRAAEAALAEAGIAPGDLGAIGAHGTGTRLGDRAEAAAYRGLLGAHLSRVPVVAGKALMGHLLGAAGGIEAVGAVLAIEKGQLPPAVNVDEPEFDLDIVRGAVRQLHSAWILTCSMGFGGNNACLVLGAVPKV
jgi:3-oxoacyl-[acyl-carrier-protein] synthase II